MGSNFVPVETILKVEDEESAEHNMIDEHEQSTTTLSPASSDFTSTGTQCSTVESESTNATTLKDYPLNIYSEQDIEKIERLSNANSAEETNIQQEHAFSKNWANVESNNTIESTIYQNAKFLLMTSAAAVSHEYQHNEEFFHQFDYKTRNIIKTKQRRSNPCYRDQERNRQRTVMRLKRQDPDFREAERERGRFRMRIKRLNPEFRKQERQRQRERMKLKRQDPSFREKEREQQKNRIHERRLDPEFRERERAQDRLRARMKRHSNEPFSGDEDSKNSKSSLLESDLRFKTAINCDAHMGAVISPEDTNSGTLSFESISEMRPLLIKDKIPYDTFQYRRGPVYNFHLYSNTKDHWLTSANAFSKGPPQFNIMKDDDEHENEVDPLLDQNNVLYNIKENSNSPEQETSQTVEIGIKNRITIDSSIGEEKTTTNGLLFNENCKTNLTSDSLSLSQQKSSGS